MKLETKSLQSSSITQLIYFAHKADNSLNSDKHDQDLQTSAWKASQSSTIYLALDNSKSGY